MPSERIQVRYSELDGLVNVFTDYESQFRSTFSRLQRCVGKLERGGWQGDAADEFFRDWTVSVDPAFQRLCAAMGATESTLKAIGLLLQNAEEEAAHHLRTAAPNGQPGEGTPDGRYGVTESPSQGPAEQEDPTLPTGTVQGSQGGGNIRSTPDSDTDNVVRFANNGEELTIVGVSEDGEWFFVEDAEGNPGWISDQVLDQGDAADLPVYNADGTPKVRTFGEILQTWSQPFLVAFANAGMTYIESEHGVKMSLPPGEEVSLTTLGELLLTDLALTEMRDEYGMTFTQEGAQTWQPWEILTVYDTVSLQAARVNALAESAGYDLSQINPYHTLFGDRTFIRSESYSYGFATGDGNIHLGDNAFYGSGGAVGSRDARLTEENPGGFRSDGVNAGERFIAAVLAGHEVTHFAAYEDALIPMVNADGTINPNWNLDSNYGTWSQDHEFNETHTFECTNSDGEVVTGTTPEQYDFNDDDAGWEYIGGSSDNIAEQSTDALNAYAMDLYTIGPEFTYEENVAGYARLEQGETLMYRLFEDRFGPPDDFLTPP